MVNEVREVQLFHIYVPDIVRLVRLVGMVNERREVQLYHVLVPDIVRLVC